MSGVTYKVACATCYMSEKIKAKAINFPKLGVIFHLFDVRFHMIGVMRQVSDVICHLSRTVVMCQMFAVTSHKSIARKGPDKTIYWLLVKYHVSLERCHVSHVKSQVSTVRCQMSDVTCHVSDVICHITHVSCQKSQKQEPAQPPSQVSF